MEHLNQKKKHLITGVQNAEVANLCSKVWIDYPCNKGQHISKKWLIIVWHKILSKPMLHQTSNDLNIFIGEMLDIAE